MICYYYSCFVSFSAKELILVDNLYYLVIYEALLTIYVLVNFSKGML